MITHIHGKLIEKTPTYDVVDVNGIGYKIKISLQTFSAIDGEWIEQEKKLDVKRHSHTSMFVPDSQLPCNQTKQKHENIRNEL